jgi:hypothetical protein
MKQFRWNAFWATIITGLSFILTACGMPGPQSGASQAPKSLSTAVLSSVPPQGGSGGGSNTGSGTSTTTDNTTLTPALMFQVQGLGNHPRHICVPAKSRLWLRMSPIANNIPLGAYDPYTKFPNGAIAYDGSPAYYTQLRVRLSIPGTSAAWDFLASNGNYSVIGDFSNYLTPITGQSQPSESMLTTPEYSTPLWGSSANDGLCTYWEQQTGRCNHVSYALRASEYAGCPTGQQKILITNIVSDYPCQNDKLGWCWGGSMQTVPDYQQWSINIQAVTESTQNFQ